MSNILQRANCELPESLLEEVTTYKKKLSLDYPVNVARNVARLTAATHFVFPSDIELYPRFRLCALLLIKSKPEKTLSDVMK